MKIKPWNNMEHNLMIAAARDFLLKNLDKKNKIGKKEFEERKLHHINRLLIKKGFQRTIEEIQNNYQSYLYQVNAHQGATEDLEIKPVTSPVHTTVQMPANLNSTLDSLSSDRNSSGATEDLEIKPVTSPVNTTVQMPAKRNSTLDSLSSDRNSSATEDLDRKLVTSPVTTNVQLPEIISLPQPLVQNSSDDLNEKILPYNTSASKIVAQLSSVLNSRKACSTEKPLESSQLRNSKKRVRSSASYCKHCKKDRLRVELARSNRKLLLQMKRVIRNEIRRGMARERKRINNNTVNLNDKTVQIKNKI